MATASEFCASIISQADEVRKLIESTKEAIHPYVITELREIDELVGNVRDELIELRGAL